MHLPKHVLDDLEHCCLCGTSSSDCKLADKLDEVEVVQARLESIFPSSRRKLASAFAEIRETVQLARAFGVNRRILFRPTLARNAEVCTLLKFLILTGQVL
jgi:translation initiation factor 2-alpha kinase 4